MTTSSISGSAASTDQLAAKTGTTAKSLNANDFINLMVTELKNQDPTQPTSADQLLSQMSQIGQLQSSQSLQTTLTQMSTQNQIGSAASLIGKSVQGNDDNQNPVSGVVTSVKVATADGSVSLELDNGSNLKLANVTSIAPSTTKSATSTTSGTATSKVN